MNRVHNLIYRYVTWALTDVSIVISSLVLAWAARSVTESLEAGPALLFGLLAVGVYLVGNHAFHLYRRIWRYAAAGEVVVIVEAVAASTAILAMVDLFWPDQRPVPLSVVVMMGLLTLVGFVSVRYRRRVWTGFRWRWRALQGETEVKRTRVLIVGAGEVGQLLAWRFLNQKEGERYQVVGFVDDDPRKHGMRVHGMPILGNRQAIPHVVAHHRVDLIAIAIHNISGADFRSILDVCEPTTAVIKIIPNVFDLLDGANGRPPIRNVTVEDLLGRESVQIDHDACRGMLKWRTILVTGAAGSIGSELCRQIVGFDPGQLLMVDNNESGLFDTMETLECSETERPNGEFRDTQRVRPIIGDVTDESKMRTVFETYRPEIVFHAAAYKHVPLMEEYPDEAVRVNVFGTRIIAGLAARYGVERFVLVSTDKAINPQSVMGSTKRIGEMLIAVGASSNPRLSTLNPQPSTLFTAVRFGNVLGSRGSVVPTFERQIDRGGPVTVTHRDMTRFLMSIPEAVSLIIQAATLTEGVDIFMLDMGQSIRIDELARRLIRLRGLRPDVDIQVVYTGVRPGEKMHEELLGDGEERSATSHPRIFRVRGNDNLDRFAVLRQVDELIDLAENHGNGKVVALLRRLVGTGSGELSAVGDQQGGDVG